MIPMYDWLMSVFDWFVSALNSIAEFIAAYKVLIMATLLTIIVSILKSWKRNRKLDWVEALICGCLTLAIYSALEYFKLPKELAVFAGGMVGFMGSLWVEKFIDKKADSEEVNK